jgi:iron(III) transport system ATP-binding protein
MQQGRLVQWATPQQLYATPRTPWLAGFIGEGSIVEVLAVSAGQAVGSAALHQGLTRAAAREATSRVPVLVRPQHVHIGTQGVGTQGIAARVIDTAYRGERFSVRLRLAGQQELLAYHPHPLALDQDVQIAVEQGWALERHA